MFPRDLQSRSPQPNTLPHGLRSRSHRYRHCQRWRQERNVVLAFIASERQGFEFDDFVEGVPEFDAEFFG
jgi:hypothetical protein